MVADPHHRRGLGHHSVTAHHGSRALGQDGDGRESPRDRPGRSFVVPFLLIALGLLLLVIVAVVWILGMRAKAHE